MQHKKSAGTSFYIFLYQRSNKLRALIDAEAEIRSDSHQVIKDIGLLAFVNIPYLVTCEEIHLYRETVWGSFLLSNDDVETLIHIRVLM